jgi:Holliday junction DNA helicase RuvA
MIAYLEGKIIAKGGKFVILNVNGVGYKVFLSQKTLAKIAQEGENLNPVRESYGTDNSGKNKFSNGVKVFCFLNVRENLLDLYGFLSFQELEFFETLNDIPGIGPKAALEVASIASIEKIKEALEKDDEEVLKEISIIGKKKAQVIILELSRKIKKISGKKVVDDEVLDALVNLGYQSQKVKLALEKIPPEIKETEERIKEALKILGK